jgi:hypothetical protein
LGWWLVNLNLVELVVVGELEFELVGSWLVGGG